MPFGTELTDTAETQYQDNRATVKNLKSWEGWIENNQNFGQQNKNFFDDNNPVPATTLNPDRILKASGKNISDNWQKITADDLDGPPVKIGKEGGLEPNKDSGYIYPFDPNFDPFYFGISSNFGFPDLPTDRMRKSDNIIDNRNMSFNDRVQQGWQSGFRQLIGPFTNASVSVPINWKHPLGKDFLEGVDNFFTPQGPSDEEIKPMGYVSNEPLIALANKLRAPLGHMIESMATLPERAIKAAGNQVLTEDDPTGKQALTGPALETASLMYGAGTTFAPEKSLGIMGGGKAVKFFTKEGKSDAALARQMMIEKHTPEQIYDATGLYVGTDNRIKFEISDKGARLRKNVPDMEWGYLPDFIDHPELFKQYPSLRDTRVLRTDRFQGAQAGYSDQYDVIGIPIKTTISDEELLKSILHETQHAVQAREGFARGADSKVVGKDAYNRSAGEVEARNVEYRQSLDLNPPEEQWTNIDTSIHSIYERRYPFHTEEFPIEDQIVNFE